MIVLDIGNSNIKCFEVFDINNIRLVFNIKAQKHLLEGYLHTINKQDIYTICTNKEFEDFIINHKLNNITLKIFEEKAKFYAPYKGYGIDRLVNSFAASSLYKEDILLVSMGSAITYDIIKKRKIEYGYITLGLSYRFECLYKYVPHLKTTSQFDKDNIDISKAPSNTQEAITLGIISEIVNHINTIKEKEDLEVVITGGDANYLSHLYKVDFELLPKGVFLAFAKS